MFRPSFPLVDSLFCNVEFHRKLNTHWVVSFATLGLINHFMIPWQANKIFSKQKCTSPLAKLLEMVIKRGKWLKENLVRCMTVDSKNKSTYRSKAKTQLICSQMLVRSNQLLNKVKCGPWYPKSTRTNLWIHEYPIINMERFSTLFIINTQDIVKITNKKKRKAQSEDRKDFYLNSHPFHNTRTSTYNHQNPSRHIWNIDNSKSPLSINMSILDIP